MRDLLKSLLTLKNAYLICGAHSALVSILTHSNDHAMLALFCFVLFELELIKEKLDKREN